MVKHKNKKGRGAKKNGKGRGMKRGRERGLKRDLTRRTMKHLSDGGSLEDGGTDKLAVNTFNEEGNSSDDGDSDPEPVQGEGELLNNLGSRIDTDPVLKKAYTELATLIEARAEVIKKEQVSRRNPFYCEHCDAELVTRGNYHEHILTPGHKEKLESHLNHMTKLIEKFCCAIQNSAIKAMSASQPVYLCRKCLLPHEDIPTKHRYTKEHRLAVRLKHVECSPCLLLFGTILEYERHLSSLTHKRNYCRRFAGTVIFESDRYLPMTPENSKEPIGSHYIYDAMGFHCTVCNFGFRGSNKQYTLLDHCRTRDHYYNYRSHREKWVKKYLKVRNPTMLLLEMKPNTTFNLLGVDGNPGYLTFNMEVKVNGKIYSGRGPTEEQAKFTAARKAILDQITLHSSDIYRKMCELAKSTGDNKKSDEELMKLIQTEFRADYAETTGAIHTWTPSSSRTIEEGIAENAEKDPFVEDVGDENDMEDS